MVGVYRTIAGAALEPKLTAQARAAHGASTATRTAVGLKPLHGLLTCGQFEISASTSACAVRVRERPGADSPSTMPSVPSSSTGTFMYQLMLETRSRFPRPQRAPSARKFSTQ